MVEAMVDLLRGKRVVALTGAGCSTESGIPDYRGPAAVQRPRKPVQYQEFIRSEEARRRYWARSAAGWARIAGAQANAGHIALAELEQHGVIRGIITQNVDRLHHAAGSRRVVELHGSLSDVRCLSCNARVARAEFQRRILGLNSEWSEHAEAHMLPDGDAEIDATVIAEFKVPACSCGGIMKPDVVFFGENVPNAVVEQAWQLFDDAEVLLVAGSSLTVYSGRRFVYRAQQQGLPIAIINQGPTRADDLASEKIDSPLGTALPVLAASLLGERV